MKKWHKIVLSVVLIFVVLTGVFLINHYGVINRVLKPFSQTCGYGGTSDKKVECGCMGITTHDIKYGSTTNYCLGQCGQCRCYQQDWLENDGENKYKEPYLPKLTEVDCSTFPGLKKWFPSK